MMMMKDPASIMIDDNTDDQSQAAAATMIKPPMKPRRSGSVNDILITEVKRHLFSPNNGGLKASLLPTQSQLGNECPKGKKSTKRKAALQAKKNNA